MIRIRALAVLLSAGALAACEKNAVQEISSPTSGAFVRFQNYGVNVPGVNFYANDLKLTAVSSTSCTPPVDARCTTTGIESTTGVAFRALANGGNYAQVAPGQYTLSSRIAAATDNGLPVSSVATTLENGKFYSYFVSGIYNATTKKSDAFVIEDALPTSFDYTKAYIRIVNASSNAPTISATTKLQGSTDVVNVASNLAYKAASPIVTLTPGLTDITVTLGGTSTTFTGISLSGGHVSTLVLNGDATATGTTGLGINASANR
jgi:Domain of unknown function (DUF4397)